MGPRSDGETQKYTRQVKPLHSLLEIRTRISVRARARAKIRVRVRVGVLRPPEH